MHNIPAFDYDAAIKTGKTAAAVNPAMAPSVVAGPASPFVGRVMRESRDSVAHPESLAIAVFFDVTGSMGGIPVVLQMKLASLMKLLIEKGYVEHPQILFGAIGDSNSDRVPLQVGQFESDIAMDEDLSKIYLEGNGGGQTKETYELAHYFVAKHTDIDCFNLRGRKGYFFTIGDEGFYETIKVNQVKSLIGDDIGEPISSERVVRELEQKYHVFHIVAQTVTSTTYGISEQWKKLLGERVLVLEDPNSVTELIAMTIGLCEGMIDLDTGADHLRSVGANGKTVDSVTNALVPFAAKHAVSKVGVATDLPDVAQPSAGVTRL